MASRSSTRTSTTRRPAASTGTRASANSNSQPRELLGRQGLGQRLRRARSDNGSTAPAPSRKAAAFIVARTPGLIAHVIGLQSRERPMRRIGSLNHWYDGHRRVWFATLSHPEDIVRRKDTGAVVYAGGGANELMTGTPQWNTGIVARGRIYFAADNKVYVFRLPTATPTPTATLHLQRLQ